HAGGAGAAEIVQRPSDDARALIKRLLLVVPAREAVIGAGAEQLITRRETRDRVDNVERRRHQRQFVGSAVFASLCWQQPAIIIEIKVAPAPAADLLTAAH